MPNAGLRMTDIDVGIYDVTGKLVWSHVARRTSHVWDALNHPAGIYLIRIKQDQKTLSKKIYKIH